MTDDAKAILTARLAELSARFAAQQGARLEQLRGVLQKFERDGAQDDLLEAIRLAHRLHGTAGTFGGAAVSEAAGRIERALREIERGEGDPADKWRAIHAALEAAAETPESIG